MWCDMGLFVAMRYFLSKAVWQKKLKKKRCDVEEIDERDEGKFICFHFFQLRIFLRSNSKWPLRWMYQFVIENIQYNTRSVCINLITRNGMIAALFWAWKVKRWGKRNAADCAMCSSTTKHNEPSEPYYRNLSYPHR